MKSPWLVLLSALPLATFAPVSAPMGTQIPKFLAANHSVDQPAQFQVWLARDPSRKAGFSAFEQFLMREKVHGILPSWSLLVVDRHLVSSTCPSEPFILPPKEQWPKIIPTLIVIRDEVQPAIGPVEIVSGYRTEAFNTCIGGARKSAHLQFGALDLIPATPAVRPHEPYKSLCRMWRNAPASRAIGLGAYYDPDASRPRSRQRFHIDTFGKRTWGFGFGAKTSFCYDARSR